VCYLDVTKLFPELADVFQRNDSLLESLDRVLSEREIAIRSFSETLKKLCDSPNSPTRGPQRVRN